MRSSPVPRGPGVGIYLGSNAEMVPQALASHLRHAGVLPRHVVVLAVKVENVPRMPDGGTLEHEDLGADIHRLTYRVGFSDDIDVPAILAARARPCVGSTSTGAPTSSDARPCASRIVRAWRSGVSGSSS